jgi:hypothetical protein
MREMVINVASYTLSLRFDSDDAPGGTMVRLPDGVEARFNRPDCLLDLFEGMVGRHAWQAHRDQIIAAVEAAICPCA